MYADRYSRIVAWLKFSLPLMALGILSTLFLISRAVDPPSAVPFADDEMQERLTNEQVTGPFYSSVSSSGDQIELIAATVKAGQEIGSHFAEDVELTVLFTSGMEAVLVANEADINLGEDLTELTGEVEIVTSQGYVLTSDRMLVRITAAEITSPGPVEGTIPGGKINAGTMRFFAPEEGEDGRLFFTNGVKLVYNDEN